MIKPLISVVMSVYNEESYIAHAIESILAQTYENLELIIIDDYSTDNSIEVCRSFKDSRIRIHQKTYESRYPAASRNLGVSMAHGEYVTFQDADDISMPERIERQLERAQELSGRRVVGCSYLRIENGVERPIIMPETHTRICRGFNRIFLRDTIVSGLILAPKLIFEKFPYQENLRYMEDWDHILKLYESGDVEFYNCQELLYKYFVRKKGVIFNPAWLNYNIFVRHCQLQRRNRLPECESLEAFEKYLAERPIERMRWYGLKQLISIKLYLYKWYRFNSRDS